MILQIFLIHISILIVTLVLYHPNWPHEAPLPLVGDPLIDTTTTWRATYIHTIHINFSGNFINIYVVSPPCGSCRQPECYHFGPWHERSEAYKRYCNGAPRVLSLLIHLSANAHLF